MRKQVLIFTVIASACYLSLSSYIGGAARSGLGNRTGSTGIAGQTNCSSGGGCHGNINTATIVSIQVLDTLTDTAITQYVPGTLYKLRISGSNPSSSLSEFGFQASAVLYDKSQAGTFTIPSADKFNMHTQSVSGISGGTITVVEHSHALAKTSGSYVTDVYWTAPDSGSGDVSFYAILNAVNGNNFADLGDEPDTAMPITIPEIIPTVDTSSSVAIITQVINCSLYPNPVINNIHLQINNAPSGNYSASIYNMLGKKVSNVQLAINSGSNDETINAAMLPKGIYLLQLSNGEQRRALQFIKQ